MGGVLGSFIGSAIILSAITVIAGAIAISTMGAGLPLITMLIVIGVGIASTAIGTSVTYKAGLFAHRKRKGKIALAEEKVLKTAKKCRKTL